MKRDTIETIVMPDTDNSILRFGAAFANSAPLAHFIPQVEPNARLVEAVPSQLVGLVLDGQLDAAVVPVAALVRHGELAMIDGIGVCATNRVRSVVLRCYRPIAQVRVVARDAASNTSNALAGILLRNLFGLNIQMIDAAAGQDVDAAVVIGDRALCSPPGPCGDIDLAAAWNEMTHLPFVFAVWGYMAGRADAGKLADIVTAARQKGLASIALLAQIQAAKLKLPLAQCLDYFQSCIHYHVGSAEKQAIGLFTQLLHENADLLPRPDRAQVSASSARLPGSVSA